MAPVIDLTTEQLEARQADLLKQARVASYSEFRERSRMGILTDTEWALRDATGLCRLFAR